MVYVLNICFDIFLSENIREDISRRRVQLPYLSVRIRVWRFISLFSRKFVIRYPDEEAGQIPMAYVVRNPGSSLTAAQTMDFIAKQVSF